MQYDDSKEGRIQRALELLREGKVVGVPTETVYGLAADALSESGVLRIFELKQRPADVPLSLLIPSPDELGSLAIEIPDSAWTLAEHFWPGPLTLVLKKRHHIPDVVTASRATVGLRVPDHPLTLELLRAYGGALACTSANLHGQPSLASAGAVLASFGGQLELVLDGGPSSIGVESTVLDLSEEPGVILRQGALSALEIEEALGGPLLILGETC